VQHAGSVNTFVVVLVLFVAVLALTWIPAIIWVRRGYRMAQKRLSSQIAAETVLRPPEKAQYEGATAPNYPLLRKNWRTGVSEPRFGAIALTRRRVVFVTHMRESIDIPVGEIRDVHEGKVLKAPIRGGKTRHLAIALRSGGEVGFYVPDNAAWCRAIKDVISQ
jgi:hypothetical protein